MARGGLLVIASLLALPFGFSCRGKPVPGAASSALAPVAPAVTSAPPAVVSANAAPSASAEPERLSPLSSAAPTVPQAERDPAVELCCKMFHPYVTGCVRPGGPCPHRMGAYCDRAWKRGATVAEIEPEMRRLAPLEHYFVPKPCTAGGQIPAPD